MTYKTYLPEQKKNIANNKKPYKGLKFAFGIKFLSSFKFIKIENYQSIINHKTGFLVNDDKINYNNSCLSIDNENN